ncbi:hypothetical protein CLU79DRAFT_739739 [Phycomyces nitens]|nr:hypothetical protein CLU79DRAFT_739739 [Phycomyces nitens]
MFLQNLQFILYFLLLIFVTKCYAPPIQQEDTQATSKLPVVSILKTVILGYMTHVLTIRPRNGTTSFDTISRRIGALIYPCSGIGTAVGSMHKAIYGDEILGIFQYNSLLKGYDREEDCQTTLKTESSDLSILSIPSVQESEKDKDNNTKTSELYTLRSQAIRLRDRLVTDQKAKHINIEDDNSAYLAAFLHVLGPEKAKKTKHCILNGSLFIGYEFGTKTLEEELFCLSDEKPINGPGAACKYQRQIMLGNVRYLSTDMIDKLESAHTIDETSYIEICITLGQLFFTTIECMDIDGDRWAKVITIIYTVMSILQATSLFILHKQSISFSIKDDQELSPEATKAALIEEDCKQLAESIDVPDFDDTSIAMISMFLGIIASLLIGIWADYNAHSTTQWLVLSWILSPIPVVLILVIWTENGFNDCISTIALILLSIASIGCLIAATIIGYLPK